MPVSMRQADPEGYYICVELVCEAKSKCLDLSFMMNAHERSKKAKSCPSHNIWMTSYPYFHNQILAGHSTF